LAARAASIREFGFRVPVVVDPGGVIICGHTRWKAAKKLQLAKVPVHVATDLTPEQIKACRIADNKTAELAEWDFDQLRIEIADLQGADFNLDVLVFDDDELTRLLGGDNDMVTDGQADPDSVPEAVPCAGRRRRSRRSGSHLSRRS
jgi:ParB-like chromosome segregation protein Spo0J